MTCETFFITGMLIGLILGILLAKVISDYYSNKLLDEIEIKMQEIENKIVEIKKKDDKNDRN